MAEELELVKNKPDFKEILRAVLKHQMKYLVEQLSVYGDEEVMVLATSLSDGTFSHLGSTGTHGFLDNRNDLKSQFSGHCIKNLTAQTEIMEKDVCFRGSSQIVESVDQSTSDEMTSSAGNVPDFSSQAAQLRSGVLTGSQIKTKPRKEPVSWHKTKMKFSLPQNHSQVNAHQKTYFNHNPSGFSVIQSAGTKRPLETVAADMSAKRKSFNKASATITTAESSFEHSESINHTEDHNSQKTNETENCSSEDNELVKSEPWDVDNGTQIDSFVRGQLNTTGPGADPDTSEHTENDREADSAKQSTSILGSLEWEKEVTGPLRRKSYLGAYKLEVIQFAEDYGIPNAVKVYNLPDATVRTWMRKKEKLQSVSENNMNMLSSCKIRECQWPELENNLESFVLQQMLSGKALTNRVLLAAAKSIAKDLGLEDFRASNGWVARFKKRKSIKTHLST